MHPRHSVHIPRRGRMVLPSGGGGGRGTLSYKLMCTHALRMIRQGTAILPDQYICITRQDQYIRMITSPVYGRINKSALHSRWDPDEGTEGHVRAAIRARDKKLSRLTRLPYTSTFDNKQHTKGKQHGQAQARAPTVLPQGAGFVVQVSVTAAAGHDTPVDVRNAHMCNNGL